MIPFQKYHGTGNDFIMIDDRESKIHLTPQQIQKMCDRHFGIGADGLIQIRLTEDYQFEMLYYNADGNRGSMCGNGGRCSVAFASELRLLDNKASFLASDGSHKAVVISRAPYIVSLQMNDVTSIERNQQSAILNTGSPHYVLFTKGVEEMDVRTEGRKIRYNDRFSEEGINVNFVEVIDKKLFIRTYERGVEDETLSCGTGVTASVIAASQFGMIDSSPGEVITPGGKLKVHFQKNGESFSDIWLEGEVVKVFSGSI